MITRPNLGYDFGAWSEAVLKDENYKRYDYYLFANSSIYGPYSRHKDWVLAFTSELKGDIKLVGSTINTIRKFDMVHVQSYIYAMERDTLKYLIECEIFSLTNQAKTFNDAIWQKEVLMSRKIISNNWNIKDLSKLYEGIDFRNKIAFLKKKKDMKGDIMSPEYEYLWKKEDVIFIKGNRFSIA